MKIYFDSKKWFVGSGVSGIRRCKRDIFGLKKKYLKEKASSRIFIFLESLGFGKMLSLDGIIQFSQSDEFHLP